MVELKAVPRVALLAEMMEVAMAALRVAEKAKMKADWKVLLLVAY